MPQPDELPPRTQHRRRLLAAAVLVAALVATVVGCTSGGDSTASSSTTSSISPLLVDAEEVTVVTVPDGFVIPDTRNAILLPIEGKAKALPALAITGGSGRISGTVNGPDGPVEGATVRVERVVGTRVAAMSVSSGGGGSFSATGLLGGAYRVRAWLPPNLTTTEASVAFLSAEAGTATLEVTMGRYEGNQLQAVLDEAEWSVGDEVTLRALLTRQTVNENGVVVGEGLAASEVRLEDNSSVDADGELVKKTNDAGIVTWSVTCQREGSHTVTVSSQELSTKVSLPGCGPRSGSTTTIDPDEELPPDLPPFPVGEEFTVPRSGVVPAGTYRTFLSGCATTFQIWKDGKWQEERVEASGDTIKLSTPARDFKPASGTDGCRYRRIS